MPALGRAFRGTIRRSFVGAGSVRRPVVVREKQTVYQRDELASFHAWHDFAAQRAHWPLSLARRRPAGPRDKPEAF